MHDAGITRDRVDDGSHSLTFNNSNQLEKRSLKLALTILQLALLPYSFQFMSAFLPSRW